MKLKLTFHGPNVVATTTREEPIQIGHAISFSVQLLHEPNVDTAQRVFEIERTFNLLTTGRVHVFIEK